jgi:hypothetical protein
MYIFAQHGILSIVAHHSKPGMLMVRAVARDDLEHFWPAALYRHMNVAASAGGRVCRAASRSLSAQVENIGYAPRNAQERQDMLQGSRLGGLIFMMKGRHGVCLP